MSSLKEENGRYYNSANVVMLATKSKEKDLYLVESGELYYSVNPNQMIHKYYTHQHLYFTSDEEIKEGDWHWNHIDRMISNDIRAVDQFCKKIISSTDKSLGLPQPSQSFIKAYIEAYNSGKPITKVMVEYTQKYSYRIDIPLDETEFDLVVDEDNCITIKKVQNTFTREEHIANIKAFAKEFVANTDTAYKQADIDKWISENL